jgi:hypothetical protein
MQTANDFMESASWGEFTLDWTTTPILQIAYRGPTCGDNEPLDWWGDKDPSALDVMAIAKAETLGYAYDDFDFNIQFMPRYSP